MPRLRAALSGQGTSRRDGYVAAALGVAAASLLIAAVQTRVPFGNISLLYLLVVLWLAAAFGRGPAIAASILAFLAYDFFFIPPLYRFTVNDPTEYISLFALLATALVLGQLTAAVHARAQDAIESQRAAEASAREAVESRQAALASQRQTETLYRLAQLIVSTTDQDQLPQALAERVLAVFAPAGIAACSIILPDELGRPVVRAVAPPEGPMAAALDLGVRERTARASYALGHGAIVGGSAPKSVAGSAPAGSARPADGPATYYVPLRTSRHVVGALGIAGTAAIRGLVSRLAAPPFAPAGVAEAPGDPQAALFDAFRTQIALALDRLALQREAVHAEALRESDHLKDVLLGSVTHDLRTPLASIQAAAGSLLEPDVEWSAAERREFLESIEQSADRLNRLVSNLLDLSRLEAGVALPEKQWYPIGDVIATVLDRLDLAGRTAGRTIDLDVPADLPLVPLDHAQMEQVLTNLIENALKYSPAESAVRIQARVAGEPPELEMRVADQGIGIPATELNAIFDKFYRVQHVQLPWAPRRPPIGTGLGLAICAAIVAEHGGRIWVESRPGAGSTFIFTLPLPQEPPRSALPVAEPSAGQTPEQTASPPATGTTG